jgi:hypothetical protein
MSLLSIWSFEQLYSPPLGGRKDVRHFCIFHYDVMTHERISVRNCVVISGGCKVIRGRGRGVVVVDDSVINSLGMNIGRLGRSIDGNCSLVDGMKRLRRRQRLDRLVGRLALDSAIFQTDVIHHLIEHLDKCLLGEIYISPVLHCFEEFLSDEFIYSFEFHIYCGVE